MKEKLLKLKESGIYEHYWLCLVATICALFLSLYSIVCLMTGSRLYFYTTLLGVLFGISSYETEIIYASMGTAGVGANVLSYGGIALTVGLLLATISGCIITIGNKRGALNSICTWVFFLCCELCISMGGIYHGFMLTTAVIISYIMGFFALAFWLTHVIDKSAYKSAQKLLKRKSKSGIALSDVNRNEKPNESTRLIRTVLIGFLPVCLIVGDILALARFKFVHWPYLIYQLLYYVTLFLLCYFVVYRIERRKDWFVSSYLVMESGIGFLFIGLFLEVLEKALPGYTSNSELSTYINGPFYPAIVALIICPIVYCFIERYIRKHEYINQLAPRTATQFDSNPNGVEKQ